MSRHKHADLIIAWANGAEVEVFNSQLQKWTRPVSRVLLWSEETQYRIKPIPKPDTIHYKYINRSGSTCPRKTINDTGYISGMEGFRANLKLTLDGETGKLKAAEVINEA